MLHSGIILTKLEAIRDVPAARPYAANDSMHVHVGCSSGPKPVRCSMHTMAHMIAIPFLRECLQALLLRRYLAQGSQQGLDKVTNCMSFPFEPVGHTMNAGDMWQVVTIGK